TTSNPRCYGPVFGNLGILDSISRTWCAYFYPQMRPTPKWMLCALFWTIWPTFADAYYWDQTRADRYQWQNLPSQLSAAILKFIRRPQLSQLHIFFIASLPCDVLGMCLAVRTLAFVETFVDDIATADVVASFSAGVEQLAISCSPDIVIYSHPHNVHPTRSRGHETAFDDSRKPSTYTHRLQCCKAQSTASLGRFLPLPTQLPSLRSIEITLEFKQRNDPSFVPILAAVTGAASPTLQELFVTYPPVHGPQVKPSLAPQTMAGVEEVVTECIGKVTEFPINFVNSVNLVNSSAKAGMSLSFPPSYIARRGFADTMRLRVARDACDHRQTRALAFACVTPLVYRRLDR
ncbi:hypothetical protein C8R45DRAFT_1185164, partial [Mycena sanguinolenta]